MTDTELVEILRISDTATCRYSADRIEALSQALADVLAFKPFDRHFDHSGAMNATQLGDHEAYLRLRARLIEASRI